VTHSDRADVTWRKSTFSNAIDCVDVGDDPIHDAILVRTSHEPEGVVLSCSRAAWRVFVAAAEAGQLDG
jgi:hypothetical protein